MLATNCITKIPQDIKLALVDGVLTLKAGSRVYDGSGAVTNITADRVLSISNMNSALDYFLFAYTASDNNNIRYFNSSQIFSGSTAPTFSGLYGVWYDTASQQIKYTNDGGSSWNTGLSFPLARFSADGTTVTSVNQVFNGFGYIGSTVFGLPGVKVLMPNGRNADGTLKNLEITTNSVVLISATQTYIDNAHYNCVLNEAAAQIHTVESSYYNYTYERPELGANKRWYSEKDNMWYTCFAATPTVWTEDTQCIVLTYTYHESAPISDFEIKAPISIVNQSMSDYVVSSFVNATTGQWYRQWKSGWLEQGGIQKQGAGFTFTLIKPFLNTKYFVSAQMVSNSPNTNNVLVSFLNLRAQTTTYFQLEFTTYSDTVWYACGKGA